MNRGQTTPTCSELHRHKPRWLGSWPTVATFVLVGGLLVVSTGCRPADEGEAVSGNDSSSSNSGTAMPASDASATAALHDLFDREWQFRVQEMPLLATAIGRHEFNDRLQDVSAQAWSKRADYWRSALAELDGIDRQALSDTDRISADIFRRQIEDMVSDIEFRAYEIPFNADSGFHSGFARLPAEMPFRTERDYANYSARLAAFPAHVDQQIANMKAGLARGMSQPQVVLKGLDQTIRAHTTAEIEDSVFWQPFIEFPAAVPAAQHQQLRDQGRVAITDGAIAGYQKFLTFFVDEYIPQARNELGASELPDGAAYYQSQIRQFTTLDLESDEIHQIGLGEVKRIRAEMDTIITGLEFDGDFAEFLQFLRTDPQFYAKTPEELLRQAAWLSKKMDGQLPALFNTFPRLPYTVEPVPDHIAPKYTAGRYVPAPRGSIRPGAYWVNTYNLKQRPLYSLEALTLHEAVPGHHFQIALNNEIEDLPAFRRFSYISAFGEGWGLYSERLGLEAGFYTDPYSNFGRLTYEMWRACRLVVDTGIHAQGWTRQQAIDYLASNTALSLHEVQTEIDRYISWPGQALAYKLGELKIRELRQRAEGELGADFDIRQFHDAVLLNGSVPLDMLEGQIETWIANQK